MAANTLKVFLRVTGFLDPEIAPAIKPTPQNNGQNVDTVSYLLMINCTGLISVKGFTLERDLELYNLELASTPYLVAGP